MPSLCCPDWRAVRCVAWRVAGGDRVELASAEVEVGEERVLQRGQLRADGPEIVPRERLLQRMEPPLDGVVLRSQRLDQDRHSSL